MKVYCLQWWNEKAKSWEGEMIFPENGNLAEEYPGGYKFWKRREFDMELPEIDLKIESYVIEAKERKLKTDWTIQSYMGFEAYWFPEGLAGKETYDCRYWPRKEDGEPLYHKVIGGSEHIKIGDEILVKCGFDYVWRKMTVKELKGPNEVWAEAGEVATVVRRKPDDRDVWVSMGLMFLGGLKALNMPILGENK